MLKKSKKRVHPLLKKILDPPLEYNYAKRINFRITVTLHFRFHWVILYMVLVQVNENGRQQNDDRESIFIG